MTPTSTDTAPRSLRLWRWVSSVSGALLWLCVAFWVLALGLFTLAHVLILPRIDVLRPTLERQASAALKLQVHIDTLEAQTTGLWPTLHLKGLAALDEHQTQVLSVNDAWLSLSWASVLRASLDHLDLEGLHIHARLDDQGQWWLGDNRLGDSGQSGMADTFFKIHSFSAKNTELDWLDELHLGETGHFKGLSIQVENGLLSHTVALDSDVSNAAAMPLSVRAQMHQPLLSLHPGQWSQWSGQVYAQAQEIELATVLKYALGASGASSLQGVGWFRFWSDVSSGSFTSQVLDVSLSNIKTPSLSPSSALILNSAHGRLRSKPWRGGREWETDALAVEVAGQPQAWNLSHLRLRLSDTAQPWSAGAQGEINIAQASLDHLTQVSEKIAPDHAVTALLRALNLKGELKDFSASWTSETPTPAAKPGLADMLQEAKKLLRPDPANPTPGPLAVTKGPVLSSNALPATPPEPRPAPSKPNTGDDNPFASLAQFRLQGHLQGFSRGDRAAAKPAPQGQTGQTIPTSPNPWLAHIPSIKGADIVFDISEHQGHANVSISDGFADFLGALEEPRIEMKKFLADVAWENNAEQLHVHVNNGLIDNTDGSAHFKFDWQRAWHRASTVKRAMKGQSPAELRDQGGQGNPGDPGDLGDPGLLDLDAQVHHLEAKALYKYLPQAINASVRQYLKEALTQGFASSGSIKIHGPLNAIPFKNPREGELSIRASLNHVGLNYYPKTPSKTALDSALPTSPPLGGSSAASLSSEWPGLVDAQGELNITGPNLSITKASAYMSAETRLFWSRVEIHLPDLLSPNLEVLAESRSALPDMLTVLNHSAVSGLLSNALQKAIARGPAELKLKLNLPLLQIERSKVQGSLSFFNNDLQIAPGTPLLTRAKGLIAFTDNTMTLQNVQVHALGGDARIEGGFNAIALGSALGSNTNTTVNNSNPEFLQLRVNGQLTSQGLKEACELGWISGLGAFTQGGTAYTATISARDPAGVELSVNSTLQGLSVSGPEPLNKSAASTMALSFESLPYKLTANNSHLNLERLSLVLSDRLLMRFFLDNNTATTRIYKGALSLQSPEPGASPNTMTAAINPTLWLSKVTPPIRSTPQGWDLELQAAQVSVDDWLAAYHQMDPMSSDTTGNKTCINGPPISPISTSQDPVRASTTQGFERTAESMPTHMNLRAQTLTVQGRNFHQMHLSTTRQTDHWLAQIESQELRGNVDLLLSGDASKRGLNAHLNYLNVTPSSPLSSDPLLSQNTSLLSWLNLSVDELELKGHPLGKLQFNTHSSLDPAGQTVWHFDPLTLNNPDATLSASGHWGPSVSDPKPQTALKLDLAIGNAGNVLDRFGMKGVLKNGKGHLKGQISWGGSLINPNFDQLSGQMNLDIELGQFLKTEPGASRLLGVLNLQALPRRLTLDFRDLFGEGFAFDNIRGDVSLAHGNASTQNLVMNGVSAAVMLEGQASIAQESQDVRVVVIPEINAGTASLIYSTINPVVGLTSFLAQYVLRQPLIKASTRTFHISGSWQDPQVTKLDTP